MREGEHQFVLGDYVIYTKSHLEARQVHDLLVEGNATGTCGCIATFTGQQIHWRKLSSQGTSASHETAPAPGCHIETVRGKGRSDPANTSPG